MSDPDPATDADPGTEPGVAALLAMRDELVHFVARRVGDRAAAEDLVQDALLTAVTRREELASPRAWIYRVLRNAIVDRARHAQVVAAHAAREPASAFSSVSPVSPGSPGSSSSSPSSSPSSSSTPPSSSWEPELADAVCRCVMQVARSLSPAHADALNQIEIEERAVADYAQGAGITANAAGVRIFRARAALRARLAQVCGACATHGCRDCTCRPPAPSAVDARERTD